MFSKISRLGRYASRFPISRFPNAGGSRTSIFQLSNFPFPISHGACSTCPHAISHFPFPTGSMPACTREQIPISHFPKLSAALVWKHTINFPFPISHTHRFRGVRNARSTYQVKKQFPERDNERDRFPISRITNSHWKSGMFITLRYI